jgi:hypothetical protein
VDHGTAEEAVDSERALGRCHGSSIPRWSDRIKPENKKVLRAEKRWGTRHLDRMDLNEKLILSPGGRNPLQDNGFEAYESRS